MNFSHEVKISFNWLNAERAKQITTICKSHGAKIQRLAQERGVLGICKVVATFSKYPGWYDNSIVARECRKEVIGKGLTNQLTF